MRATIVNTGLSLSYAFFDVDDTLISVKSMLSFQDFWFACFSDPDARAAYQADLQLLMTGQSSWEELNRRYYQHFAGRRVAQVKACGEAWFLEQSQRQGFYYPAVLAELRRHQQQGREVVFVSGSFPALLRPIARQLQVTHILATSMEIRGNCYTGRIIEPQTIGEGKAVAMRQFLAAVGGNADDCYAYGDDITDVPMLRAVGNPRVISGGRRLEDMAMAAGWQVMSPY